MTQPYVYKFTHLPTLKWYIGSRWKEGCHPDESFEAYPSSGKLTKKMILANPEEWSKEIIDIGTKEYVLELETIILQTFDAKNDPRSFNGHNNTLKHFDKTGKKESASTREKKSLAKLGIKREEHSAAMKKYWSNNSQRIKNLSDSNTSRKNTANAPGAKTYKITYPDNSTEIVKNITMVARSKGWSGPTVTDIIKGKYIPKRGKLAGIKIERV
jgi:hypothetical protein